jgi:hypothetical protein
VVSGVAFATSDKSAAHRASDNVYGDRRRTSALASILAPNSLKSCILFGKSDQTKKTPALEYARSVA